MADPTSALTSRVQEAMAAAFGPEWRSADPVIRPANKKQTNADVQVNAAMAAAKKIGKPPREVAQAIIDNLKADDLLSGVEMAGPGFLNLYLRDDWIAQNAQSMLLSDRLDVPTPPQERIALDYSSPNAAKEMHVGHLRTTVVGDALARTLEALGHTVLRQNHLGDWGTAFGMLIEHLLEVGEDSDEAKLLINDPNAFYRAARAKFDAAEAEGKSSTVSNSNAFDDRARRRVTLLQGGDAESLRLWQKIIDLTKVYLNRVYSELGITLTDDDISGESSYNDELPGVCKDLEDKGIAVISDGALCVFLDGYIGREDKPVPLIIRKSDGGYGYATSDIATLRHYSLDLKTSRAIYVIGTTQSLHLQMCWETTRKAGWVEGTEPIHVKIGSVLGGDGKVLRTRSGDLVTLQSLVDGAIERAGQVLTESRPDLDAEARKTIAHQVGIGAIKYADLSISHDSEYTYDLDRMVALQGNTGPYLQYATARIRSILRRADAVVTEGPIVVTEAAERAPALRLLDYGSVVEQVGETLEPHRLAAYLFDLAQTFTTFYEQCPVLKAEEHEVKQSRLALCALTLKVLVGGLGLLGIESPDQM